MIECCHRKAVRFQIEEELACKLLGVDNRWDIDNLLKAPFEIAPTEKFFIDYNLSCSNEAEGEGMTAAKYPSQKIYSKNW